MNKRLFFLKHEGWFEAELSGKLLSASGEELILWAYDMMDRYNYRNYWIMESSTLLTPHSSPPALRAAPSPAWRGGKLSHRQMIVLQSDP